MPRLVSRAEYARLRKISRPAVTKLCKGKLAAACVDDRIDLDHPAAQADLGRVPAKGARSAGAPTKSPKRAAPAPAVPTSPPKGKQKPPSDPTTVRPPAPRAAPSTPAPILDDPDRNGYPESLHDLTLFEIVRRWGTIRSYKDILEAHEKKERGLKMRLDNAETEKLLISRKLVEAHVFGAIESTYRRLLGDSPKTIVRTIYTLANTGAGIEEAERVCRGLIESQLKEVKKRAKKGLSGA